MAVQDVMTPTDATTPDATAPDATAPDATAPDATTPDATAPADELNAQKIIAYIAHAPKKTPVKLYVKPAAGATLNWGTDADTHVFGTGADQVVFGNWEVLRPLVEAQAASIADVVVEGVLDTNRRNSGVPLLDVRDVSARIEPGALIREKVEIGPQAVIMMGAIINIGAHVGAGTMIDMGAVLGGRAIVGDHCHIGAGAVLAGVVEPASATPVIIEDNVLVGANAVVIEGIHVGEGAVVAAGAVVVEDVPPHTVVAGCPARVIKTVDEKTSEKTALIDALRTLSF